MVRILHLRNHPSDFQTERSAELLQRQSGNDFEIETRTIGPGGTYRNPILAAAALRRAREFDLLHAWGTSPLTAAALGFSLPLVLTPVGPFRARPARWLRAVMTYRD